MQLFADMPTCVAYTFAAFVWLLLVYRSAQFTYRETLRRLTMPRKKRFKQRKPMPPKLRNAIAAAHSLRGGSGSGIHTDRKKAADKRACRTRVTEDSHES